jgi:hypothetical protein
MFFAFLSLAVIGIALFIAAVAFYSKKDRAVFSIQESLEPIIEDSAPEKPIASPEPVRVDQEIKEQTPAVDTGKEGNFIPIIHMDEPVPGIQGRELVHFLGKGTLFSMESTSDPEEIAIDQNELQRVVEGKLLLTSRYIIITSGETVKKFTIAAIEKHHFSDPYLIMKRKRVKTKKDVLRVDTDSKEFKQILHTLA